MFWFIFLALISLNKAAKVEYDCGTEFKENQNSQIIFGKSIKKYEMPWFCEFKNEFDGAEIFSDTQMHDLALIKIENVQYTRFLRPICLISYEKILENSPVTVVGSGLEFFHLSGEAKKAEITVRSLQKCTDLYGKWTRSNKFELCAGKAFTGVRQGDSGGPLMAFYQNRYYLIGIISAKTTIYWSGNFRQDEKPVLFSRVAPEQGNVKCHNNVIPITAINSNEIPCGVVSEGRNQELMKIKNIKTLQPWYCKIFDESGNHFCSGTLTSFRNVLTSSDCIPTGNGYSKITIKCGIFFQTLSKIGKVRKRDDVAVIELDKEIKFDGNVGVVCLTKNDELESNSFAQTFYIDKVKERRIVKSIDVTPLEAINCGSKAAVKTNSITVRCNNATSPIKGAPLLLKIDEKWHVIGIISEKSAFESSNRLNFTRVSQFCDFLTVRGDIQCSHTSKAYYSLIFIAFLLLTIL